MQWIQSECDCLFGVSLKTAVMSICHGGSEARFDSFFESRYVHCGLEILFPNEFLDSDSRAGLLFHLHSAAQPVTFSDGKGWLFEFCWRHARTRQRADLACRIGSCLGLTWLFERGSILRSVKARSTFGAWQSRQVRSLQAPQSLLVYRSFTLHVCSSQTLAVMTHYISYKSVDVGPALASMPKLPHSAVASVHCKPPSSRVGEASGLGLTLCALATDLHSTNG